MRARVRVRVRVGVRVRARVRVSRLTRPAVPGSRKACTVTAVGAPEDREPSADRPWCALGLGLGSTLTLTLPLPLPLTLTLSVTLTPTLTLTPHLVRAADLLADGVLIVVRRVVDDPPVAADVDCDAGHVYSLAWSGL